MSLSTASCLSRGMAGTQGNRSVVEASPCCKVSSLGVKKAAVALSLAAHRFFWSFFFPNFRFQYFFVGEGGFLQPWNFLRVES